MIFAGAHCLPGRSRDCWIVLTRTEFGTARLILVLIPFLFLWGCQESPDEARFKLGELGYEFTPVSLLLATDRNDHVAVQLLILAGMDPDTKIDGGVLSRLEGAELLSQEFRDWADDRSGVRYGSQASFTALILAAALGHVETLEVLLDAGADRSTKDGTGQTALMRAAAEGHRELVERLLDEDVDLADEEDAGRVFRVAVSNNHTEIVQLLLDAGVDRFIQNNLNFTALIEAVSEEGGLETAAILIDAGVAVNAQGVEGNGDTALIRAVKGKNLDAVRMLLDANADPNLQNRKGNTALIVAADQFDAPTVELVGLLLDAGADPNLQNEEGTTALMRAAHHGYIDVVRMLLDAGANPNFQDGDERIAGHTALGNATRQISDRYDDWMYESGPTRDVPGVVMMLLEAGADPNVSDEQGITPFKTVIDRKDLEIMQAMVDAGADANVPDAKGWTLLMRELSSWNANGDIIQLLLQTVTDRDTANLQNQDGVTGVMMAIERRKADAVRGLLEAGADPDIRNAQGQTALMYIAAKADRDMLTVLLEAGADPTLQDAEGRTALDFVPMHPWNKPQDPEFYRMLRSAVDRWQREPPLATPDSPAAATSLPTASPVVEIDADVDANLTNETYVGGMKTRGMKVYALSGDGNWCAEKVVFKITAPSETVFTDGTAEFYMKRFGERINEAQFCPAARAADIHGYTDTGTEPVFTGKATAAAGWSVN